MRIAHLGAALTIVAALGCSSDPEVTAAGGVDGGLTGAAGTDGAAGRGGGSSNGPDAAAPAVMRLPDAGAEAAPPPPPTAMMNCGLRKIDLQRLPAELLMLLDRSSSMADQDHLLARLLGFASKKWSDTTSAIDNVVMRTQSGVHWGLKLFPMPNGCGVTDGVNVPVAMNNHGAVMAAIRQRPATGSSGSTPTRAAVLKATEFLRARQTANPRYLLVATDGLPNCGPGRSGADEGGAVQAIATAAAAGIPVFVVGIATVGSDAHDTLNEMATRGGRPRTDPATKYYPVGSREELVSTLETITGQIASCTFPLDPPPPVPQNVAVEVDGVRLLPGPAAGWSYGPGNQSLTLNGAPCDRLKAGTSKNVQIIYGCPGMIIP